MDDFEISFSFQAPWKSRDPSCRPPKGWPKKGRVEFRNYATRYREELDLVLKGVTADIRSQQKVGIIGHTGAGKNLLYSYENIMIFD